MPVRQPPGPLSFLWCALLASLLAGCATTSPVSGLSPLQRTDLARGRELSSGVEWTLQFGSPSGSPPPAPITSPGSAAAPAPAAPPGPAALTVAMGRATSYYQRGLQAMQSGDADQAEWEFDAALETLLTTNPVYAPPAGLAAVTRPVSFPPSSWVRELAAPMTNVASPSSSADDSDSTAAEEPPLDAPALLGPDDIQAVTEAPAKEKEAPDVGTEVEGSQFPIILNDEVESFLEYFQTRKWGVITQAFERASRYLPMMRRIFQEKALPEELTNLAFIESAVNPHATSRAKAAGIWQFIPSTARLFGMHTSWWLDERRDPEKSTRAAAEYLKTLHEMFDSWPLALAAYNLGEGALQRAIQRQRTRDFWSLKLPRETKLFVPAIMAMTLISHYPERYGFSVPPEKGLESETVRLLHPTDLKIAAQAAGTSVERIRELNPELTRGTTPPDVSRYSLRIPAGRTETFLEAISRIPPAERVRWATHRVRKGETLRRVARQYRVDPEALAEMNGLGKRQALKVGMLLRIPSSAESGTVALAKATRTAPSAAPVRHAGRTYVVRPGDTLSWIAKSSGVSLNDLRRWNRLSRDAALRPGQTLLVVSPAEIQAAAVRTPAAPVRHSSSRPAAKRRYVVKQGDTLWEIGQAFGVSPEDLRRWNKLSKDAAIRPGQELHLVDPAS